MGTVTNAEFLRLTEGRSNRLRTMARKRYEGDARGSLTTADIEDFASVCKYAHEDRDVTWLRTLGTMVSTGRLSAMRSGKFDFADHAAEVQRLVAQQKIPFGLKDMVVIKDSGKAGVVADYNTETKEYIVILNPFQLRTVPASDLLERKERN
jgi:hypothetical protein